MRDATLGSSTRLRSHPLFCDKGLGGAEFQRTLGLIDVELITPARHRLGERPPAEVAKATIRLIIELVFANLKAPDAVGGAPCQDDGGLVQRIGQRLLALTLGMFINAQVGRPLRALAAYDGR